MDFDKLKQWMEFAQKYQKGDFWNQIFEKGYSEQFMNEMGLNNEEKHHQSSGKEFPSVDILQSQATNFVLIDLPGLTKEDIHLSVSGDILNIKGNIKGLIENATMISNEKHYGEFERNIILPEPSDGKNTQAQFKNGLLIISFPRVHRNEETITIE